MLCASGKGRLRKLLIVVCKDSGDGRPATEAFDVLAAACWQSSYILIMHLHSLTHSYMIHIGYSGVAAFNSAPELEALSSRQHTLCHTSAGLTAHRDQTL